MAWLTYCAGIGEQTLVVTSLLERRFMPRLRGKRAPSHRLRRGSLQPSRTPSIAEVRVDRGVGSPLHDMQKELNELTRATDPGSGVSCDSGSVARVSSFSLFSSLRMLSKGFCRCCTLGICELTKTTAKP